MSTKKARIPADDAVGRVIVMNGRGSQVAVRRLLGTCETGRGRATLFAPEAVAGRPSTNERSPLNGN